MSPQANPVNWFEIPVTDLSRAKTFYESAFGIEIAENEMGGSKMGWFPMEKDAAGAAGTLIEGDGYVPSHHGTLVYFSVEKIDRTLQSVDAAGGKIVVPRTSIGEYGFIAHFEDSEGNRVALHEPL